MRFFVMYQAVGLLLMAMVMAAYVVQQRQQSLPEAAGAAPLPAMRSFAFTSDGGGGGVGSGMPAPADVAMVEPPAAPVMEEQPVAGVYAGYKHCCVIDAAGQYITFVQVHLMDYGGEIRQEPQYYTLGDGEHLVDANPPTERPHAGAAGFISPRWDADASAWVETATAAEIAEWEAEHPAPEPPAAEPTMWDKMDAAYQEGVRTAYDS